MTEAEIKQRKLALQEAKSTWISPRSLTVIFVVGLIVTIMFNGL
jgi:hypothetical protein